MHPYGITDCFFFFCKISFHLELTQLLPLKENLFSAAWSGQICAVHSVEHGPVISEFGVSGTTFAPEGIIFDSTGTQVILFCISCNIFTSTLL